MKVLFFAQLQAITGVREYHLSAAHGLTAEELWERLETAFPKLSPWRTKTRLACNSVYAAPDAKFQEGDEVALLPPVSGG